jgi:hypothetical protein
MIWVGHFGPHCLLISPAPRNPLDGKLAARSLPDLRTTGCSPLAAWLQVEQTVLAPPRCKRRTERRAGSASRLHPSDSTAGGRHAIGRSPVEALRTSNTRQGHAALGRLVAAGAAASTNVGQRRIAERRKPRRSGNLRNTGEPAAVARALLSRGSPPGERNKVSGRTAILLRESD